MLWEYGFYPLLQEHLYMSWAPVVKFCCFFFTWFSLKHESYKPCYFSKQSTISLSLLDPGLFPSNDLLLISVLWSDNRGDQRKEITQEKVNISL